MRETGLASRGAAEQSLQRLDTPVCVPGLGVHGSRALGCCGRQRRVTGACVLSQRANKAWPGRHAKPERRLTHEDLRSHATAGVAIDAGVIHLQRAWRRGLGANAAACADADLGLLLTKNGPSAFCGRGRRTSPVL